MKKTEVMELLNSAELLGKTLVLKDMSNKTDDPLIKMANGGVDMMAMMLVDRIMNITGFSKEEFAEQFSDYDSVKQYIEFNEKLNEAQKRASAE